MEFHSHPTFQNNRSFETTTKSLFQPENNANLQQQQQQQQQLNNSSFLNVNLTTNPSNTASSANLLPPPSGAKRLYNYAPPAQDSTKVATENNTSSRVSGIESGAFTLKKQYAYDKLNEKERDLFEEYQKRINESVAKQQQQQHQFTLNKENNQMMMATNSSHKMLLVNQAQSKSSLADSGVSPAKIFQVPQRILNPIVFNASVQQTPTALSTLHHNKSDSQNSEESILDQQINSKTMPTLQQNKNRLLDNLDLSDNKQSKEPETQITIEPPLSKNGAAWIRQAPNPSLSNIQRDILEFQSVTHRSNNVMQGGHAPQYSDSSFQYPSSTIQYTHTNLSQPNHMEHQNTYFTQGGPSHRMNMMGTTLSTIQNNGQPNNYRTVPSYRPPIQYTQDESTINHPVLLTPNYHGELTAEKNKPQYEINNQNADLVDQECLNLQVPNSSSQTNLLPKISPSQATLAQKFSQTNSKAILGPLFEDHITRAQALTSGSYLSHTYLSSSNKQHPHYQLHTRNSSQTENNHNTSTTQILDVSKETKKSGVSKRLPPKLSTTKKTQSKKAGSKVVGKENQSEGANNCVTSDRRSTKNMTDKSNGYQSQCSSSKGKTATSVTKVTATKKPKPLQIEVAKERKSNSENKSDNLSRGRSRSFEVTRRSESRSNSAIRRTPKITNESVEKEISHYFQKKFNENMFYEKNLQDKIDFIRKVYLNHNHIGDLSEKQRQQIRDLSADRRGNEIPKRPSSQLSSHTNTSAPRSKTRLSTGGAATANSRSRSRSTKKHIYNHSKQVHSYLKAHSRQKAVNNNQRMSQSYHIKSAKSHHSATTSMKKGPQHDTANLRNVGTAIGTIEKLLKLLSDHCKVCPQFAEEFEKLNL